MSLQNKIIEDYTMERYKEGYNTGLQEGYNMGLQEGTKKGMHSGYMAGVQRGMMIGAISVVMATFAGVMINLHKIRI